MTAKPSNVYTDYILSLQEATILSYSDLHHTVESLLINSTWSQSVHFCNSYVKMQ